MQARNITGAIEGEGGTQRIVRDVVDLGPWARVAHARPEMAQAAYDVKPPNANDFRQAMRETQRDMPNMVDATMQRELQVPPTDRATALADLERARRQAGNAMFNPLRGESVAPTQTMLDMLQVAPGKQAANAALNVERNARGNPNLELGDVTGGFPFWHNAQQVYGDYGRRRMTSEGALSGPEAGAAFSRQKEVLDEMYAKPWGPQYQAAREAYRANSQVIEALGNADAFAKLPRDELQRTIGSITAPERAVYAMGIVQKVREAVRTSPESADQARNVIKSAAMRENLGALIGVPRAEALVDALDKLSEGTQAYNRIFHGSKTASQLTQNAILGNAENTGGVLYNLMQGEPLQAVRSMLMPTVPKARVLNEGTARNMLDLSMARTQPEIEAAMLALRQRRAVGNPYIIPGLMGGITAGSQ
jgi:hypothetical protein